MEKEQTYDELYNYILEWVNYINPCEIRLNSKKKLTCKGIESKEIQYRTTLCCGPFEETSENTGFTWISKTCNHLNCKGCTVKSLSCKLWFCESAWKNIIKRHKPKDIANFMLAIQYVQQTIRNLEIPCKSRQSKEENFESIN
jgi:hypothetical protein